MIRGIMDRLREDTLENHKRAESRAYESELAGGRLPRDRFVEGLGQRFLMHRAMERHVRQLVRNNPALQDAFKDELYQERNLVADLNFFGVEPGGIQPLIATRRFIAGVERAANERPLALIGAYYVFEGSKNGARMIAHAVRAAYGLTEGNGTRYLDPHGSEQRTLWRAFRERLNVMPLSTADADEIVAMARFTFDCIADLDDEVMQPVQAGVPA
jgi:heme oxygenase